MASSAQVTVLGYTQITDELLDLMEPHETDGNVIDVADIDYLHEYAGRLCYNSSNRPNPLTAENADYLNNILAQRHYSVLAHGSVTLLLEGISRSCAHEIIRSRFLAFSEISQRYVDPKVLSVVYPPDAGDDERANIDRTHEICMEAYEHAYEQYRFQFDYDNVPQKIGKKRARSAARAHLPLSTETKMVVSGNIRAWRDFIVQRTSEGADEEIKQLAYIIRDVLRDKVPNSVSDL